MNLFKEIPRFEEMKLVASLTLALMLFPFASAFTQVTIYVDPIGDALFLGESDSAPSLPLGVTLKEGRINGYTSILTEKEGELWRFDYVLPDSEMVVVLPEGAVIKSLSNGEITVERGQIAIYALNGTRISYTIEKSEEANGLGTFITIIGALVALVIIAYLANYRKREGHTQAPRRARRVNKLEVISSVLNERENLILEKLKGVGKTKMSYLRKACNLPKASFSRHIHELVRKKLITLSGEGKNKFVSLRR